MRHVRMLGTCLLAFCAIGAVYAAGAFAAGQPTFSTSLSGKFAATTLKAKSAKGVAEEVICKKGKATGTLTGEFSYAQTITLEGCKSNAGTTACGNAAAETIETNSLNGELYWVNKAETTPGAVEGAFEIKFTCGAEKVDIASDLIGTVANSKTGFSISYKIKTEKQEDRFFFIEGLEEGPLFLVSEPGQVESPISAKETVTEVVQA